MFRRILVGVCLVIRLSGVACEQKAERCKDVQVVMIGYYDRRTNSTSVGLKIGETRKLAYLDDSRLVSPYPWINMSDVEPEQTLALSLIGSLTVMASDLSGNNTLQIMYVVSKNESNITVSTDEGYVTFNATLSCITVEGGISDTNALKKYAGKENFTTFLGSKDSVLKRWTKVCEQVKVMDVPDNLTASFEYRTSTETFVCTVNRSVPVDYQLDMQCTGANRSAWRTWMDISKRDGETVSWIDRQCNVSTAVCVVKSASGWEKRLNVTVVFDAADRCAAGAGAVAAVVTIFLLGLLLMGYVRYRTTARPVRGMLGLVRERVGCVRLIV